MSAFTFSRTKDKRNTLPGEWRPVWSTDRWSAIICCQKCGQESGLSYHTIDANGAVSPSVNCPTRFGNTECPACGFHVQATLAGWPPYSEDNCPGHVASEDDPKICGICHIHIETLR